MAWTNKDELDEIKGINNICDRIIEELDEEHPWMTIVRYLVEKIKKEYGEINDWSRQHSNPRNIFRKCS